METQHHSRTTEDVSHRNTKYLEDSVCFEITAKKIGLGNLAMATLTSLNLTSKLVVMSYTATHKCK